MGRKIIWDEKEITKWIWRWVRAYYNICGANLGHYLFSFSFAERGERVFVAAVSFSPYISISFFAYLATPLHFPHCLPAVVCIVNYVQQLLDIYFQYWNETF